MSDLHKLLDECQSNSEALVAEINSFKQSRILNEKTAKALESTAAALHKTLKEIKPLTEKRILTMFYVIGSATILNMLMFAIILWIMFFI